MTLSPQAFTFVADLVRPGGGDRARSRQGVPRRGPARSAGACRRGRRRDGVRLDAPGTGARAQRMAVVEALTTNETSWFRDCEPFEALRTTVAPQLLSQVPSSRRISLVGGLLQRPGGLHDRDGDGRPRAGRDGGHPRERPVAGDGRPHQGGCYTQLEVGRGLPAPLMVRHFRRTGTQWQVRQSLDGAHPADQPGQAVPAAAGVRRGVPPQRAHLLRHPHEAGDPARVRQVLSPDGLLFLGGAETTLGIDDSWDRTSVGRFTFYRPATRPTPVHLAGPRLGRDSRRQVTTVLRTWIDDSRDHAVPCSAGTSSRSATRCSRPSTARPRSTCSRRPARRAPVLATVDWNMPVMDGLTFVQQVRSRPEWRSDHADDGDDREPSTDQISGPCRRRRTSTSSSRSLRRRSPTSSTCSGWSRRRHSRDRPVHPGHGTGQRGRRRRRRAGRHQRRLDFVPRQRRAARVVARPAVRCRRGPCGRGHPRGVVRDRHPRAVPGRRARRGPDDAPSRRREASRTSSTPSASSPT